MLKGVDGVVEFCTKRRAPARLPGWEDEAFYQPAGKGEVKQQVIDWMEGLRCDNPHSDLFPQLLELSLHALQVDPESRPDMKTMHHRLAVLSLQKYFHSLQAIFCKVCGTRETSASLAEHHLGSLRFAQERFEVWGYALALARNLFPAVPVNSRRIGSIL